MRSGLQPFEGLAERDTLVTHMLVGANRSAGPIPDIDEQRERSGILRLRIGISFIPFDALPCRIEKLHDAL